MPVPDIRMWLKPLMKSSEYAKPLQWVTPGAPCSVRVSGPGQTMPNGRSAPGCVLARSFAPEPPVPMNGST